MRKNIGWAIVVVAAALLQTTWLESLSVMDVVPDLSLLLVVYFAIAHGPERAMFTGVLSGLFQDVARNAVLGHNVLCYVIVGYAAGRVATRLATEHPAVKAGLVFMASLVLGLLSITILYVQDPGTPALHNIVARVVPGAFYTALCTPILFFVLDRSFRRSEWAFTGGTA